MRNIIGGIVTIKPVGNIVTNNPVQQPTPPPQPNVRKQEDDNYLRAKPCQPNPR